MSSYLKVCVKIIWNLFYFSFITTASPTAFREGESAQSVQGMQTGRSFRSVAIGILLTIKRIASHALELSFPKIGNSVLLDTKGLGPFEKIIKRQFPPGQNPALPMMCIARIQPLLIEAATIHEILAAQPWQSCNIAHK